MSDEQPPFWQRWFGIRRVAPTALPPTDPPPPPTLDEPPVELEQTPGEPDVYVDEEPAEEGPPARRPAQLASRAPAQAPEAPRPALPAPAIANPFHDGSVSGAEPWAEPSHTGALFRRAADALAFLGAVAGAGLASQASSLLGPGGGFWIEVPASPRRAASLVFLAGGRPFGGERDRWTAVLSDGTLVRAEAGPSPGPSELVLVMGVRVERLHRRDWKPADLSDLLGGASLRRALLRPRPEIAVAVPSALGRWVLGRAMALGLEVALVPAERRPLAGGGDAAEGVVWMRMRAPSGSVPAAFMAALSDLPGAHVGYPAGAEDARLFIDVRCEPPLAGPLLEGLLPRDEAWILGALDAGHARIRLAGEPVDGASLLVPPSPPPAPLGVAGEPRLPAPIQVRLVRRSVSRPTDALLLDERELGWLRTYLMTRPLGESIFLAGGAERFLVLAGGDLAARVPFGLPLARVGPRGLYLEQGIDLFPPLPEEARLAAFQLGDEEAVVLTEGGSYRFRASALAPAWSLWAGVPPAIKSEPPGETLRKLLEVGAALHVGETDVVEVEVEAAGSAPRAVRDPAVRARLRSEASQAEVLGDLETAARKLEEAGDLRAAGRMYERAALGFGRARPRP